MWRFRTRCCTTGFGGGAIGTRYHSRWRRKRVSRRRRRGKRRAIGSLAGEGANTNREIISLQLRLYPPRAAQIGGYPVSCLIRALSSPKPLKKPSHSRHLRLYAPIGPPLYPSPSLLKHPLRRIQANRAVNAPPSHTKPDARPAWSHSLCPRRLPWLHSRCYLFDPHALRPPPPNLSCQRLNCQL
jgi:hypothetical protein